MKIKIVTFLLLVMTSLAFSQSTKKPFPVKKPTSVPAKKALAKPNTDGIFAEIETTKGKIIIQLEFQKTPVTVANFISLAEGTNTIVKAELKGKPFYNGLKFHRVINQFMIQGGDPLGNGSGDPGYKFKDEFTDLKHDKPGVLSMANSGPKTNGSQFFITHVPTNWLDGKHTVFGHVTTGMDVVNKIVQDDVIIKVTIVRKGVLANKFDASKIFATYFANKAEDDKKEAALEVEKKKKQLEAEAEKKKLYTATYGPLMAQKVIALNKIRTTSIKTESGLEYAISKTDGKKPVEGTTIYVHYAGYLEDGSLFDSSYEEVNRTYGKFDQARANQNGYQPFPFSYGNKGGLIPGFLEGINLMSFGDKATFFIPSKLGYGEKGASGVIPPNSNIIFEVELLETLPVKK